jgi:hypothetical protein
MRLLLAKNPTGFNKVLRTLFSDGLPRHILFILNDNIADGQDISWIWDVDFESIVGHVQTLVVSGTRALDLAIRLKYAGFQEKNIVIIPSAPLKTQKHSATKSTKRAKKTRKNVTQSEFLEYTTQEDQSSSEHRYGLKNALDSSLQYTPIGETLFIVPSYTGLLEVHRELEQRGFAPHYWEGRDA